MHIVYTVSLLHSITWGISECDYKYNNIIADIKSYTVSTIHVHSLKLLFFLSFSFQNSFFYYLYCTSIDTKCLDAEIDPNGWNASRCKDTISVTSNDTSLTNTGVT